MEQWNSKKIRNVVIDWGPRGAYLHEAVHQILLIWNHRFGPEYVSAAQPVPMVRGRANFESHFCGRSADT